MIVPPSLSMPPPLPPTPLPFVLYVPRRFGFDPKEHFVVPDDVAKLFASRKEVGKKKEEEYDAMMETYEVCLEEALVFDVVAVCTP